MTRILHVLDHSLPLHSGYSFRTRAILTAQRRAGLEVRGVTSVRHQASLPAGSHVEAVEQHDGLTFHRTMEAVSGPPGLREWRDIAALARATEATAAIWKPDILHAHSPALDGLAAIRAGRRLGLPVLYEIRAFWEDAAVGNGTGSETSAKYWLTRQMENRVVAQADAVAVICAGLRDDLIARGFPADKIMVSPNGVDLELFGTPVPADPARAEALGLTGKTVLGFIGSFYPYEGLDDLIAAMPLLIAHNPDIRLLLVGGGPAEADLRAQAEASPAAHAIRFVGRVPHSEVEHYYSLTDILVYPRKAMRLTETVTPLKPLEAMAQGRLVAASNVGGHRELIADGVTGTLFAPDDPQAMADALAGLIAGREGWDERRATARRFVAKERNWARNVERYQPVYQRMLERTMGRRISSAA
ncbi:MULTISPECIES: TIGR04063 family PEP-CTERM/XrtA system glycosyltransferase [Pseudomonadota]|jgi:PEP-CTERM/exosortase A-associated glycosyltransferase|uniref:TIGR04063 family PEP-CTERM/XrtA system glycosyltransferase n=1 Tax=Pseudomonadota TaxID=1224 RepID=UPI00076A727E|nr:MULTISPECIES: TIGR04063 family PEP-CTERM/XrtA system glycosyltransferase [Pseudomonadota]MAF62875.1 glycosyltransferase, exosortase A system-associated [Blastomonas sp.]|tara:strand:- start:173028 stop:174275 length:1248 start_codon:yes stop_codon:yes gene_type:complete